MFLSKKTSITRGEFLFFSAFVLGLFCAFYDTTTFKSLVNISPIYVVIRIYMLLAIGLKCIYIDRYSVKHLLMIAFIVMLGVISTLTSDRAALFEYIVILVGSRNINPKKIIKVYLKISIPIMIAAFICSNLGIIVDYTILRKKSDMLRHSFGFVYTTDFAAHILYIILAVLYIKKKMRIFDFFIIFSVVALLHRYCNARLSEGMIIFSGIAFYLLDHNEKVFNNKPFHTIVKLCGFTFALISILLANFYDVTNPTMVYIDETIFNGRNYIAKKVIDMYGFSLFGQKILMQGDGYKTYTYNSTLGTTYIDSAYTQIALLYGFVFLAIILLGVYIYIKKIIEIKNTRLLVVIFLVLCSCIHNQYLILIAYNPFMVIMGAYIFQKTQTNEADIKS